MFNSSKFFSRIMGIKEVQRQSMVSFIWQIASAFIGFLSTMYFAHTVGASVIGAYFLFIAYFGIISMFSSIGFGGAAVKRISEGEEPDAYFSAFLLIISLFTTAIVAALIAFRYLFVDLIDSGAFVWLLIALIISLFNGVVSNGIIGRGKIGIFATGNFINNISRVLVQVVAVFLGFGLAGLAGGFVAGMIVSAVVQFRFFDLHLVSFGWRHIKSLSTFAFWTFLTSSGMLLYSSSDKIIIGYFLTNADVGIYQIVLQFVSLASFITLTLNSVIWPKVSRWGKIDEVGLIEESLSRAISYSLILAVPIVAGGVLLGDRLLYFFYGAEFERGYATFVIQAIVQIVNIFQIFFISYLSALDHQKEAFKVTAVGGVTNIVLNILLIPVIGIEGAAIATLVTMALNVVLARHVLSQIITIQIEWNSVWNILKASLVMSVFVGGYRMFVPLSDVGLTLTPVILGGAIYGFLILKFDRKIRDELKEIAIHMNVPWPKWL